MAEILVSFAVDKLLSKAISLAAEEVRPAWGFKEELTRLSESLPLIQALLRDAEKKQEQVDAVKKWLKKVKDIACDAEDVLDELTYETLRRQVELQKQMKKKVRNFFSPSNNPIKFRLEMARKISNINKLLEKIKGEANIYGLVRSVDTTNNPQAFSQDRGTVAFVDHDSIVIGRENDESEIVKKIINSGNINEEVLSVIPIVGMAGLGKTALAQLVYNNNEIKRHFDDKLIWVCVSDNFDSTTILSECLESLDPTKGRMGNLTAILENLKKELGGKRYLLVLDDVWNEDPLKWESLKSRLLILNSAKGSSIIVTTRSDRVASVMETLPPYRYRLGKLLEEDCWRVFEGRAFGNGGTPMTPELEAIGRKIVNKCAGVPLAAKFERDRLNCELENLKRQESYYRTSMACKRNELESLQQALKRAVGSCSSVEDLNDLNQRLCYRILHGSNSLAEEKKLFREIKQVEETKEKVVAYAAATKKWDSLGPKEATLDQIKLIGINLGRLEKDLRAVGAKIKCVKKEMEAMEKDIRSLQKEVTQIYQRKEEAEAYIFEQREQQDKVN